MPGRKVPPGVGGRCEESGRREEGLLRLAPWTASVLLYLFFILKDSTKICIWAGHRGSPDGVTRQILIWSRSPFRFQRSDNELNHRCSATRFLPTYQRRGAGPSHYSRSRIIHRSTEGFLFFNNTPHPPGAECQRGCGGGSPPCLLTFSSSESKIRRGQIIHPRPHRHQSPRRNNPRSLLSRRERTSCFSTISTLMSD